MPFGEARTLGFNNQPLARLLIANSIINKKGMFFYSGTPAFGNLIESVGVTTAGTDRFGNAYLIGDTVYGNSGGQRVAAQLSNLGITFYSAPTAAGAYLPFGTLAGNIIGSFEQTVLSPTAAPNGVLTAGGSNYLYPSGDVTGVTDLANINNALAHLAGPVVLTAGTYYINGTISMGTDASLIGLGASPDKNLPLGGTIIHLVNGSNVDMISVSGRAVYLSGIMLDCNGGSQTAGRGISVGTGGDWSRIDRCGVYGSKGIGIDIENVEAVKVLDCSVQQSGNIGIAVGITTVCSDVTIRGCLIGSSVADNINTTSYVVHILDCDIFSSSGGNGIKVSGPGTGTMISGCGIDRNNQHGIVILAPNTSVIGCTLHSNSQGANNTFNSITVNNASFAINAVAIEGCDFWLDAGIVNKVAWHIFYQNVASVAKTHGNGFIAASAATGTISAASQVKDPNETA